MASDSENPPIALVSWPNAPLTSSLVLKSLNSMEIPPAIISDLQQLPVSNQKIIQWDTVLSSSYIFRKALIRKHFLSRCIHSYVTKYTTSILKRTTPRTYELEISFVDELDEMWTDELWDLGQALDNPDTWWILKPGMADRGMGIRLFHTKEGLEKIFQEFEDVSSDDEDISNGDGTAVVTSQLRHFVIQEYIMNPLLIDPSEALTGHSQVLAPNGHKFHLRAYCVASGALDVYLYDRVLALFSSVPYQDPIAQSQTSETAALDLTPHLTNTSLQTHRGDEGVRLLEELIGCHTLSNNNSDRPALTAENVAHIVGQLVEVLAETFKAALATPIHFQPLGNAFELYGIDFLIASDPLEAYGSTKYTVKLLEINAEPAIELTGPRLTWILEDLFVAIGNVVVEPFVSSSRPQMGRWPVGETRHHLIKCLQTVVRN